MEKTAPRLPKISFKKVRNILFTILLGSLVFTGGYFVGLKGLQLQFKDQYKVQINRVTPPEKNVDFSLFWRVWDSLGSKYFDKTKLIPTDMVYGAISGMVAAIGDPYTAFLPPEENKVVNEDLNGSFEGVGIQIGYRLSRLAVISPLPDSPAERVGIKAGDYIVRITDEAKNIDVTTEGMNLARAVQIIRGKAGTNVKLTLIREGSDTPLEVNVTREKVDVPSVVLKFVGEDEKVAHLKVNKFGAETTKEWNDAVTQILSHSSLSGIIIDLRNNPGGYMQAAIDMASDFVDTGKVIVTEDHGDGIKKEYTVSIKGKLLGQKNVVIMINGGSASASEIFAGALRDQKGFKLLGEKSFGKGTIQEPIEIAGGSGLHVTIAKWLTPNGVWVHDNGLLVDYEVKDDENTIEDEQLQKAIELLK